MRALMNRMRRDERGITLVELIVAISLTALLLTLVGAFFVSVTKTQRLTSGIDTNTRQGTTAITQITRYLHQASRWQVTKTTQNAAFISATPTQMTFYSAVNLTSSDSVLSKVSLSVDATQRLVLSVTRGTCPADGYCTFTGSGTTTYLASGVQSATADGSPLFSYVDVDGDPLTVTASTLDSIRAVTVNLQAGADTTTDATFQTTIDLRNLDYGTAADS